MTSNIELNVKFQSRKTKILEKRPHILKNQKVTSEMKANEKSRKTEILFSCKMYLNNLKNIFQSAGFTLKLFYSGIASKFHKLLQRNGK